MRQKQTTTTTTKHTHASYPIDSLCNPGQLGWPESQFLTCQRGWWHWKKEWHQVVCNQDDRANESCEGRATSLRAGDLQVPVPLLTLTSWQPLARERPLWAAASQP